MVDLTPRPATPADREAVVATVVAAFVHDPAFRYFFPDDETYDAEATAFAGALFDARVGHGTVWMLPGAEAVSLWEPPAAAAIAPVLPPIPVSEGAGRRIEAYEQAVHSAMTEEPHWYLGVLATHPDHAGQRLGRAMITPGVERAADDGVPAILETTNPANVELYQRAGWTVVADIDDGPLPIWILAIRL